MATKLFFHGDPAADTHTGPRIVVLFLCVLLPAVFCGVVRNCRAADVAVIEDIRVDGLVNVKKKQVLAAIETAKGDLVSENVLHADIQEIFNLGYFEDVTVDIIDLPPEEQDGMPRAIVTFLVTEKPIIHKIVFTGNKRLSSRTLRDDITSRAGEGLDQAAISADMTKIRSLYQEKGYADVQVEHFIKEKESSKNRSILTYYITEGNRILIAEVKIDGITAFKPKKILKLMKIRRKKVFKQETLTEDLATVLSFYKNRGYLNAAVSEPVVSYDADRTRIFVRFEISEGSRYVVRAIQMHGNTTYADAEIRRVITLRTGRLFKEEDFTETLRNIQELYADKGYLRVAITHRTETDDEAGMVDIILDIIEGGVVYVERIYIDGNVTTREKIIRREIIVAEGEPFSALRVRRSMERIMNLGFIDDVQIDIQQPRSTDAADLVFEIVEGKPGVLSAGAGFSSVDGMMGTLSVTHINLFGRAQRLNLMWEFGERRQSYDIGFTEPWFLDRPVSLGLDVFDTVRLRQYGSDTTAYRERRQGGNVRVGPRFSDIYSAQFTYSYENIRVFDIDQNLADDIFSSEDLTSSLTAQLLRDTRDNVFDPTRGSRNSASVQVAGGPFGGNVHFYKPTLKTSWYFPTFWKFVFSVNCEIGRVESFAPSSEVPIYERYYIGGADSIRGYDYRNEIGPMEGGKFVTLMNAEYQFPIVQEKRRTILQGAFFVDVGGAWLSTHDVNLNIGTPVNWMKSGVGFGLRFKTPVFPIRLDWGYGLNHKPGEDLSQFYFTIGTIF